MVVFCRFHTDLDAVHEACDSMGYSSFELSGRRDELKRWQDGEAQVLAVQISAGGVGVDLTRARYSAYFIRSGSRLANTTRRSPVSIGPDRRKPG